MDQCFISELIRKELFIPSSALEIFSPEMAKVFATEELKKF